MRRKFVRTSAKAAGMLAWYMRRIDWVIKDAVWMAGPEKHQ